MERCITMVSHHVISYLNSNGNKRTANYYLIITIGHTNRLLLKNFQGVNTSKLAALVHAHRVEMR